MSQLLLSKSYLEETCRRDLIALGHAASYWLSRPRPLDEEAIAALTRCAQLRAGLLAYGQEHGLDLLGEATPARFSQMPSDTWR